jgi:hypothetical protein
VTKRQAARDGRIDFRLYGNSAITARSAVLDTLFMQEDDQPH